MTPSLKANHKEILLALFVVSAGFLLLQQYLSQRGIAVLLYNPALPLTLDTIFQSPLPSVFYPAVFVMLFLLAHLFIRYRMPAADPYLLPVVVLLTGIGTIIILRLAPDLAAHRSDVLTSFRRHNPGAPFVDNVLLLSQLGLKHMTNVIIGVLVMLIAFTVCSRRFLTWISSKKYLCAFSAVVLIVLTLLYGEEINRRRLWLFGFQTVELVKLLMLFFIAGYLYERGRGIEIYSQGSLSSWVRYTGPYFVVFVMILLVLFLQKDLGPAFLLFVVFLLMIHVAGNRKIVTLTFFLLVFLAGFLAYKAGYPPVVRARIDAFMDPFGMSASISRVLWSLAAGGFWGVGLGYGQAYRIPEVQSDFNFTAICEELGLLGSAAVIILYLIFCYRCLVISQKVEQGFDKALLVGIGSLTMTQALIIIAGNIKVIPLTGITLPFISYGGSSLIMHFIMAGIALRISTRTS